MTELICTNGHVYIGKECDRCGAVASVDVLETKVEEKTTKKIVAKENPTTVKKIKEVKKTTPKKVIKKGVKSVSKKKNLKKK